jgi:Protein of unknown function (DUF3738)
VDVWEKWICGRDNCEIRTLLELAVLLILSGGVLAQNDARLQFDVASIKPAAPDQHGTYIRNTPDERLDIGNMALKEMIVLAWRIQPFQISGASMFPRNRRVLLNQMKSCRCSRGFWRPDSSSGCGGSGEEGRQARATAHGIEGGQLYPARSGPTSETFLRRHGDGPGKLNATGIPIATMTSLLSRFVQRTVVDKTGLTAKFDIRSRTQPVPPFLRPFRSSSA